MTVSHCSSVSSQTRPQLSTPALATRMSSRPNCSTPSATSSRSAASSRMSTFAGQYLASFGLHRPDGVGEFLRSGRRIGDAGGHRCADVERDDVGTLSRQPDRVRPSLATRGTGDECHPPLQCSGHTRHPRPLSPTGDKANSETETCSTPGDDAVGAPPACGGRSDEVGALPSPAGTTRLRESGSLSPRVRCRR